MKNMFKKLKILSELILVSIGFIFVVEGIEIVEQEFDLVLPEWLKVCVLSLLLGVVIYSGNRVRSKFDDLKIEK